MNFSKSNTKKGNNTTSKSISVLQSNTSYTGGDGHTHPNLDILNLLDADSDNYVFLRRMEESLEDGTIETVLKKICAGYADEANGLTDEYYATLKGLLEALFLSKTNDDTAQGIIKFLKGWISENFTKGSNGSGLYKDEQGNWHIQAEYMHVLKKFIAETIEIMHASHIGGKLMQTAANMVCAKVEEHDSYYRCYMRTKDADGNEIENMWKVGDQAYCETFNLVKQSDGKTGNHFFWRLVTDVKDDYIDLSKILCAKESDAPMEGDYIVQLGYQRTDDADRQNAQILCGAGEGSPYIKQYVGINSFNLPAEDSRLKPGDNMLSALLKIKPGSTGATNISDLNIGGANILRNSGFNGNYDYDDIPADKTVSADDLVYGNPVKFWDGNPVINEDSESASGKSATITELSQKVKLINGESYVLSFKAKGTSLNVSCGNSAGTFNVSVDYDRYIFRFIAGGVDSVTFNGDATICDIQLERGTIPTAWGSSSLDNNESVSKFKELDILGYAIKEASTSFVGGLGLMQTLMLGMYRNGVMDRVTAGVNGLYDKDDDVAFWGGGTLEQAIALVGKFKDNPEYQPTDEEWESLAKFVVTHGGDLFMRGYIFAEGGYFRGLVDIGKGFARIDPKTKTAKLGNLSVDRYGIVRATDMLLSSMVWVFDYNYYKGEADGQTIEKSYSLNGYMYKITNDYTINGYDFKAGDILIYWNGYKWLLFEGLSISTDSSGNILWDLKINPNKMQNIDIRLGDHYLGHASIGNKYRASSFRGNKINISCSYCGAYSELTLGGNLLNSELYTMADNLNREDGGYCDTNYTISSYRDSWIVDGKYNYVTTDDLFMADGFIANGGTVLSAIGTLLPINISIQWISKGTAKITLDSTYYELPYLAYYYQLISKGDTCASFGGKVANENAFIVKVHNKDGLVDNSEFSVIVKNNRKLYIGQPQIII